MKNLKYLAVGILTGYVLRYVYDLTTNNKNKRRFFTVDEVGLTEENEEYE